MIIKRQGECFKVTRREGKIIKSFNKEILWTLAFRKLLRFSENF